MEIRKVGRPKKINAIKPGQLKKGERRFTFIASEKIVDDIKKGAKEEKLKIKEYFKKVFHYYWSKNKTKRKEEILLKSYLNKKLINL
jgi:hypothetical protein